MKRKISVLAVTLMLATAASAQLSFGIKGGLNLATITNGSESSSTSGSSSSSSKTGMKLGPQVGGFIAIGLSDMIAFQPELLFSFKGYSHKSTVNLGGFNTEVTSSNSISYLEIPLLLRINATESVNIHVGPYIGLLTGAKQSSETIINGNSSTSTSSSTNGLTSTDFGLTAGLGFQGESGFGGGIRYGMGFNSVFDPDNNEKNANSVIQLYLSFGFGGR